MELKTIQDSIAYCGLVCCLCHEREHCSGCRSEGNQCGHRFSAQGCYQYECCREKGLNGCWECAEGPCDKDMFGAGHDIRNATFIKVAKAQGLERLSEYLLRNLKAGIVYGWNRDYDNLGTEEAVIDLLQNGPKSPFFHK